MLSFEETCSYYRKMTVENACHAATVHDKGTAGDTDICFSQKKNYKFQGYLLNGVAQQVTGLVKPGS